jgi:hypothetical protein
MLITELSTYVLGSKGMLLSARCKTEVGPRWSHMLPHSKVIILPFSLVQSLGLVRGMGLSFSESRMSRHRLLSKSYFLKGQTLSAVAGCKDDSFLKSGFV